MAEKKNKDPVAKGSSRLKKAAGTILRQAASELASTSKGSDPLADFLFNNVQNSSRRKDVQARRAIPYYDRVQASRNIGDYRGKEIKDITTRRLKLPTISTGDKRVDSEMTRVFSQIGGVVNDLQEQTRNAFRSIDKRTTSLEGSVKNIYTRLDKVQAGNKILADQFGDLLKEIDGEKRRARSTTSATDLEKAMADRRARAQSMKRDEKGRFVKEDESSGWGFAGAAAGAYGGLRALKGGAAALGRGALPYAGIGAVIAGTAAVRQTDESKKDIYKSDVEKYGREKADALKKVRSGGITGKLNDWLDDIAQGKFPGSSSDTDPKKTADAKPVAEINLVSRNSISIEADKDVSLTAKNDITIKATRIIFDGDVVFKKNASAGGQKPSSPDVKQRALPSSEDLRDPRNSFEPASVQSPGSISGRAMGSQGSGSSDPVQTSSGSIASPMGRSTGSVSGSDLGTLGSNPGGPLGALIARGESGARGYNAYNRGTANQPKARVDFSQMTLGQVMAEQSKSKGDPSRLFAVGKYQVIPSTMRAAVKALGLDPKQQFTPELQEKIYRDYLIKQKQKSIGDYITGKHNNLHSALNGLASEWAAIADPSTGKSKYGGSNAASISSGQAAKALQAQRQAYQDNIKAGMKPDEAYAKSFDVTPNQSVAQSSGPKTASLDPSIGTSNSKTEFSPSDQMKRGYHTGGKLTLGDREYTFGSGGAGLGSIPYGSHKIGKFDTGAERAAMGRSFRRDAFNLPMAINDPKIGATQGGKRLGILIHGSSGSTVDQILTHGCLGISKKDWPEFKKNLIDYQKKYGNLVLDIGPSGARIRSAKDVPQNQVTRDPSQFVAQEKGKETPFVDTPKGSNPFDDPMSAALGINDIDKVTGSPVAGTELDGSAKPIRLEDQLGFRKSDNVEDRRQVDTSSPYNGKKWKPRDTVAMQQARKDMGLDFSDKDVDRVKAQGREDWKNFSELKQLDKDKAFQDSTGVKFPGYNRDRHSELEQQYNKDISEFKKNDGFDSLSGYVTAGKVSADRLENPSPAQYEAKMPKPVAPDLDPASEDSGKRITAEIKDEASRPSQMASRSTPQGTQSDTSIRRPTHDPEAAGPTPGSDGYGSKKADPDGCAFCSV